MATNSYMVVHQHPEAQIQTANTPTSLENRDTVTAHLSVAKRSETVPGSCEWTLALCTTLLKEVTLGQFTVPSRRKNVRISAKPELRSHCNLLRFLSFRHFQASLH